jgi:hypothetical protein
VANPHDKYLRSLTLSQDWLARLRTAEELNAINGEFKRLTREVS